MKPIFIVGNSRSGTSMMGRILGNHHLVYTIPHEIHFFEELWDPSQGDEPLPSREAVGMLSRLLCVAAEGYLKHDDPSRYEAVAMEILQTGGGGGLPLISIGFFWNIQRIQRAVNMCATRPRIICCLPVIFWQYFQNALLSTWYGIHAISFCRKKTSGG